MADRLSDIEIQQFINDGYVKLENAFPSHQAKEALHRFDNNYFPIEIAIRKGIGSDAD